MTYFIVLDEEIRSTYKIDIVQEGFEFKPLSADGSHLTSSPTLNYNNVKAYFSYVPRNETTGDHISACDGLLGCDGFDIPVIWLQRLSPASGYAITIPYHYTFPGNHGRRLLGFHTQTVTQITSGIVNIVVEIITTTNSTDNFDRDLGVLNQQIWYWILTPLFIIIFVCSLIFQSCEAYHKKKTV